MKILVIGPSSCFEECKAKLGNHHEYSFAESHTHTTEPLIKDADIIFDFIINEAPEQFRIYTATRQTIFLNTSKISLHQLALLADNSFTCTIFGFNGLPTLFNRSVLEISLWRKSDYSKLTDIANSLGTSFLVVEDHVGLVTPRVLSMIINEAYFTLEEGTASRQDIDLAMKLGTNYPFGPFEWCKRIGIKHIYEVLQAVYNDTKDDRYKICPLLRKECLNLTT